MKHTFLITALIMSFGMIRAKVHLPQIFQSGMVLQRNQPIPIWGTADPGETVNITFRGKTYTTTASQSGNWRIDLPKHKATSKPLTLTVTGSSSPTNTTTGSVLDNSVVELSDILIGDVWLVSGQSNIDCTVERVYPQYSSDIDTYTNDNIRFFQVPTNYVAKPQSDIKKTSWKHCNKQNAWKFSAIGYFLAQQMYGDVPNGVTPPLPIKKGRGASVPQGIIQASLGGTDIQSWMCIDSLRNTNYYTKYLLYTDSAYVASQTAANNRANDVWFQAMNQTDPGLGKYERPDYDDSKWNKYSQYDNNKWARISFSSNGSRSKELASFAHAGSPILGSIWLRQHINIDKAHAGKTATLNLGTFHDMDYTYVNGKQVGVTYYQYPPRRYTIPEGLLHEGDNVICIRLICKSGIANFYKDKPHNIVFSDVSLNDTIQTSTDWLIETGSVMPEGPLGGKINTQNQASMLYNGMLRPLAPYAISGVVWYQGENNTDRWQEYGNMLCKLTGNWRTIWQRPTLPFNIVQLANYMEPSDNPQESGWAALREQQRLFTDKDPYSSLTVNIDLGEASDIHPLRKREVAERIALAFKSSSSSPSSSSSRSSSTSSSSSPSPSSLTSSSPSPSPSPEPVSCNVLHDNITLTMTQPLQPCTDLREFEVKGSDGKYHNAKASTDGTTVTVTIPDGVTSSSSVRYAWKNNPAKANLLGKNGLPATPFQIAVQH